MQNEQATLGGGCFWCLEAVFEHQSGVKSVTSGYAGGAEPNPSYEAVCTGNTGHAEVIQVEYDPETISYTELLDLFWGCHDPTTLNRQGGDVGTQYRSVILYHDAEQQAEAGEKRETCVDDRREAPCSSGPKTSRHIAKNAPARRRKRNARRPLRISRGAPPELARKAQATHSIHSPKRASPFPAGR